jgi:hypothetical protein
MELKWTVKKSDVGWAVIDELGRIITITESEERARLIAAAPVMRSALEVAANELTRLIERGSDSSRSALAVVCSAIAKADHK